MHTDKHGCKCWHLAGEIRNAIVTHGRHVTCALPSESNVRLHSPILQLSRQNLHEGDTLLHQTDRDAVYNKTKAFSLASSPLAIATRPHGTKAAARPGSVGMPDSRRNSPEAPCTRYQAATARNCPAPGARPKEAQAAPELQAAGLIAGLPAEPAARDMGLI